jgi:hypothetical protein
LSDDVLNELGNMSIVCSHVAKNDRPILRALRTEPLEPEDSGWQFLCGGTEDEDDADAEVWSLQHILEVEPTLANLLVQPLNTVLQRQDLNSEWEIVYGR